MSFVLYDNGEDGGSESTGRSRRNEQDEINRIRTNSISVGCEIILDENKPTENNNNDNNLVGIHEFYIEKHQHLIADRRSESSIRKLAQVKQRKSTTTTLPLVFATISHIISRVFVIIGLMLLLSLSNVFPNLNVDVSCARTNSKPGFLYGDDLIEGRLDTRQLCGTRYSGSPFQYQQLKYDYDANNKNQMEGASDSENDQPNQIDGRLGQGLGNSYNNYNNNNNNNSNQRENLLYIVGGDEVDDDQFWPWSVAIYELDPLNGQKAFICSGSLISEKFILTAAHCIQQSRFDILSANEIFLKIASVRLDDDRSHFYQVESVFVHPDYSVDRKANDIALLRLHHGQRLPARARPICLPSHVANRIDFTDQLVTVIGWGKTTAMEGNEPSRLIDVESAETDIVSNVLSADQPLLVMLDEASTGGGGGGGGSGASSTAYDVDDMRRRRRDGQQANNNHHYHQNHHNNNNNNNNNNSSSSSNNKNQLNNKNNDDASQTNDTLLQAEVRVTNTDQCNKNYSKLEISWLSIDEHFLCASDPHGKRDACQGDSGGPLMWNNQQPLMGQPHDQRAASSPEKWYQLGLVSFGYGCANKQYPGVYTRISYYMPWILKIVNGRQQGNNLSSSSSHYINHHHSA